MSRTALEVSGVRVGYGRRRSKLAPWRAEHSVIPRLDLSIEPGTAHGLVGESGSGKSTLAMTVVGLAPAWEGTIRVGGRLLASSVHRRSIAERHSVQMVFQDPRSSLDPRWRIRRILREALAPGGGRRVSMARITELLESVGLDAMHLDRLPHEFSGGQQQRIAIARSLLSDPELLVLDEAVSALDLSVQAQVLNLLKELQRELGLTYLFISHDLAVVGFLCSRISVMYQGRIVEEGSRAQIMDTPAHPYTRSLLAAIPGKSLLGIPPLHFPTPATTPPEGPAPCPWVPAGEADLDRVPNRETAPGHLVACSCPVHYNRSSERGTTP